MNVIRHAEATETVVNLSVADDLVVIEVVDNGIGVPEDQAERVFEPMVRLDKRVEGMGIGLATCRRVVDAHGGTIGVADGPDGVGSVFWVELPA